MSKIFYLIILILFLLKPTTLLADNHLSAKNNQEVAETESAIGWNMTVVGLTVTLFVGSSIALYISYKKLLSDQKK